MGQASGVVIVAPFGPGGNLLGGGYQCINVSRTLGDSRLCIKVSRTLGDSRLRVYDFQRFNDSSLRSLVAPHKGGPADY